MITFSLVALAVASFVSCQTIPACAVQCVVMYCGDTPSAQCLCANANALIACANSQCPGGLTPAELAEISSLEAASCTAPAPAASSPPVVSSTAPAASSPPIVMSTAPVSITVVPVSTAGPVSPPYHSVATSPYCAPVTKTITKTVTEPCSKRYRKHKSSKAPKEW